MFSRSRPSSRRQAIREDRPDHPRLMWQRWKEEGLQQSLLIAIGFWIVASGMMMLRQNVLPYRPGQYVPHDIVSRVDFFYHDSDLLKKAQQEASEKQPRIYRAVKVDALAALQELLLSLPELVATGKPETLPEPLRDVLDGAAITRLQQYRFEPQRKTYEEKVGAFVRELRNLDLVIIPEEQRTEELGRVIELASVNPADPPRTLAASRTYTLPLPENVKEQIHDLSADMFMLELQPKMAELAVRAITHNYELDEEATSEARNRAAAAVPYSAGNQYHAKNKVLVRAGMIEPAHWQLLKAEHETYIQTLKGGWKSRLGTTLIVGILTVVLSLYIASYQRKVLRNHARAGAIAALLLSMLLMAQLAGIGPSTLYFFGIAPTLLTAMILCIAYDRRFALGVASIHGLLVTLALDQNIAFYMILWTGVLTCCFLLDDIRTRSKLIEVGGATAVAMIAANAAAGLVAMDPIHFIIRNCLYTGAAGLAVGFVVLGILPFIEKAFRITTSMTLLELADASHPLLRRLSMEAPGTYNHSLQVATLAEEAAESIGANALLCRVASYYHDVGKINKAEYFIENQINGENRHLNLSPSVSLLIIIGHVKDGIELAKEYNLPTSVHPFIQQHHGTTLVEYFYNQACKECPEGQPAISETQYRYPGPKPRSKEVAVVMLSDACESACRALRDINPGKIEAVVRELARRRLEDGQFDESDLTIGELETVQKSLIKTLQGIYHGRIAYPSTSAVTEGAPAAAPAAKTA